MSSPQTQCHLGVTPGKSLTEHIESTSPDIDGYSTMSDSRREVSPWKLPDSMPSIRYAISTFCTRHHPRNRTRQAEYGRQTGGSDGHYAGKPIGSVPASER